MKLQKAFLIFLTGGLFLFLDQLFKWQATHDWDKPAILTKHIGWELFLNKGAAFGIPIGNTPVIFFTIPIISLVIFLCIKELKKNLPSYTILYGLTLIISGASSNLFDRLTRTHVIDYWLLGTAIINLADLLIMVGLLLYSLELLHTQDAHYK